MTGKASRPLLDKAVIARNSAWSTRSDLLGSYQGSGHHAGECAAARDAVKKEALRRAGIGYHEVVAGHRTAGELRALVNRLVPGGCGLV